MTQKERWWVKPPKKVYFIQMLSWPFIAIAIFSLLGMFVYQQTNMFLFGDKKDIINNKLSLVADYISIYNTQTAKFVNNLDRLIQSYNNNENVFETQKNTIDDLWWQITNQDEKILLKDNIKYKKLFQFIDDLSPYKEELLTYLWSHVSKSYLVILQNSSEKRPNWWFFWSFAYIRILHGKIMSLHIIDSYLWLKTMPWVKLTPPERSYPIYNNEPFWWIASNKFWFTNIDWDNLIQLYNKTFNHEQSELYIPEELCKDICHRPIEWVIFVKTDTLKKLIPWLEQKTRERQFMNAAIDLMRWENLPNKKEYYLKDSKDFFAKNQTTLLKNIITQFWNLTDQYSFGIHIPTLSDELREILSHYHLNTIPNNKTIYSWDTNKAFNKIDEFVNKSITIRDNIGDIVYESSDNDQININTLWNWKYTMIIEYAIKVPDQYKQLIQNLEKQHNITLTDRELGILSLEPTRDIYDNPRLRSNRSQLYYPQYIEITNIQWDQFETKKFQTPFSKWLEYAIETDQNNIKKSITLSFTINN